jgi:hypothetical protein
VASEIRRLSDGEVVAVGANAIRDGDRFLIALLLPSQDAPLDEFDVGEEFEIRDTGMFLMRSERLILRSLPSGAADTAAFSLVGNGSEGKQAERTLRTGW